MARKFGRKSILKRPEGGCFIGVSRILRGRRIESLQLEKNVIFAPAPLYIYTHTYIQCIYIYIHTYTPTHTLCFPHKNMKEVQSNMKIMETTNFPLQNTDIRETHRDLEHLFARKPPSSFLLRVEHAHLSVTRPFTSLVSRSHMCRNLAFKASAAWR